MTEQISVTICSNIGASGSTPCFVQQKGIEFEARMGIEILGNTQMTREEFAECDHNPFHEKFWDNFVSGKGLTQEEAIEAMLLDLKETTRFL